MGSIYIYEKDMGDKDCTGIGLCGPLLVKEAKYEVEKGTLGTLTFTHVKDEKLPWSDFGKWKYLQPGRIVKAVIPVRMHEDFSEQSDMRMDEMSNASYLDDIGDFAYSQDVISDDIYPFPDGTVTGKKAVIFNWGGIPCRIQTHDNMFNALKAMLCLNANVNQYNKPLNKPENKVTWEYLDAHPEKVVYDEAAFNKLKWCLDNLANATAMVWNPAYNKGQGRWENAPGNPKAFPHLKDTSIPAPKIPRDEKFTKTIKVDSCDQDVALLQKRLIYLGFLKKDESMVVKNQYQYEINPLSSKDDRKIYRSYKGNGTSGAIPNPGSVDNPTIVVGLAVKAGSTRVKVKATWKIWNTRYKRWDTKTNTGWIETKALKETTGKSIEVIEGETSNTLSYENKFQLFRIHNVSIKDDDGGSIEVTARPLAYDLVGNLSTFEPIVYEGETIANVSCAEECVGLLMNTVDEHNFKIHSNIYETRFARDYVNQNVLNALIDTKTGVLADWYGSQLLVDDDDIYIINNAGVNRGKRVLYSKDLTGIELEMDHTEAYSAVRPKGQDKDGYPIWLDGVERYVREWNIAVGLVNGMYYKHNGKVLHCIKGCSNNQKCYIHFETNDYFEPYKLTGTYNTNYPLANKTVRDTLRAYGYTSVGSNTNALDGDTNVKNAFIDIQKNFKINQTGTYDLIMHEILTCTRWSWGLAITSGTRYVYYNKNESKYILKKCIQTAARNLNIPIEFRVHTEYVNSGYQFFEEDGGPDGYTEYYYGKSTSGTYFGGSDATKYMYKLPKGYKFYTKTNGKINGSVIMPDTVNGYSGDYNELPYPKIKPLDVGDAKEGQNSLNKTTLLELLVTHAIDEFESTASKNSINTPKTSLKVEFAFLGDTEEFKQYRELDKMFLYDPVYVGHKPLDMHFTMQCVKFEYDPILERMNSAEFGTPTPVVPKVGASQLTAIDGQSIKSGTIDAVQIKEGSLGASSLNSKSISNMTMAMDAVANVCTSVDDFEYNEEDPTYFYMNDDPREVNGIEVKENDVWCCTKEGETGTYLLKVKEDPGFIPDPEPEEPVMMAALYALEEEGPPIEDDLTDPEVEEANKVEYEWTDISDTIRGQTARTKIVTTWTSKYDQVVKEASKQQQHLSVADNGAIVMTADFKMDTDGDGTQEDYHSKMILDSGAIRFNIKDDTNPESEEYSSFTTQYVQFGNYMLRKTTEGGMAFIFVNPEDTQ